MEIAAGMHKRWFNAPEISPDSFNMKLSKLQRQFRSYKYNIYVLNHVFWVF